MRWRGLSQTLVVMVAAAALVAAMSSLRQPLWSEAAPARQPQPSASRPVVEPPQRATAMASRPAVVRRSTSSASVRRAQGSGGIPSTRNYPDFARLKPFSVETSYLSLPGYVRYWVHREEGRWITYAQATEIVKASRPVKSVSTLGRPRPAAPGSRPRV